MAPPIDDDGIATLRRWTVAVVLGLLGRDGFGLGLLKLDAVGGTRPLHAFHFGAEGFEVVVFFAHDDFVIPAQAGIRVVGSACGNKTWVPALSGNDVCD